MTDPVGSPLPPLPAPSPPPPAEASNDKWYIGAIINVVGSISINLGMNLMKLGHSRRDQLDVPEEEKPPIRKFRVWVIGLICFIVGNVLNFVSFAFAAQSLLAALGSFQLVCNVVFAYFVNHEPVNATIILSTCCIIGGCVVLVLFGNQSSKTYTVRELIQFYKAVAYIVYLVLMGVFVVFFYIVYLRAKRVCRKLTESGVWYVVMLVSYAIYSALLGSQSVLFGKTISTVLRTTIQGDNQLGNWYTYVAILAFLITALFYVTRMNKGLRIFPAMLIVPVLQIAWTLFSIISGMLYFQEYESFQEKRGTLKAVMFTVGVLIVFAGVFILTMWGKRSSEEVAEPGTPDSSSKVTVHDNAMYSAAPHPEGEPGPQDGAHAHQQQSKMSLGKTLRITSSWAPPSVAVSPSSHLNRTLVTNESLQRQRRATVPSELGTDEAAAWGGSTVAGGNNSTLNRTGQSNMSRPSETSMMSTMRKSMRSVHSRLTNDLGVETVTGLKLAMGLGDQRLTGVSVFAMPALDFTATQRRSRAGQAPVHEAAILRALPKSKFPRVDVDPLDTIQETIGATTLKPTASETVPSLTASSQLPLSSHGGESAPTARTGGSAPEGSRRSALPRPPTAGPTLSPSRSPLTEDVMQDRLPGPAFKMPSGKPSDAVGAAEGRPRSPPIGGSGAGGPRLAGAGAGAPNNAAEGVGRLPLPSVGPRGAGGFPQEGPAAPMANGGRGRAGSWSTALPDGVPLSTTNSVVMHESRPSTPPEQMLATAGPGGGLYGAYSRAQSPSPLRQQTPPPAQLQQLQHQYPPSVRSSYQHFNAPAVPLSMLHRPAGAQGVGGVRLPPLHLVVPGMTVQQSYTVQQQQQYGMPVGRASAYQPASMSYMQMLASQMQAEASSGGGSAVAQVFNQAPSFEGSPPATGGSSAMMWQSRPRSPHGLSVSRSWMDGGPGGQPGSQQLPVRGGLLRYLQRPLRPWHN